ncbi:hypothetical protein EMGBS15_12260 [Filimonas sp.]|nr:hypothetical protein EMGBS15_12260 [Filimonas sp.]
MNRTLCKLKFLILILCLISQSATAQFQGKVYEPFQDAQVWVGGTPINSPWCGGINSVQINRADLNNDGKSDLILYDHNSYIIKTFINTGSNGQMKYSYDPKYEKNFPSIYNYLILKDYNCDGIPDLFHKGIPGVSVYKGYYQGNELKFTFYRDLYFPGTFGQVNVYVQPDDIPAIIDIDGDGDLDVVAYGVNGTYLEYTKNLQVELGLPCDTMRMQLVDNCYGKFYQGTNRAVTTGITCPPPAPSPFANARLRHTGNCIALLDIEGDGDLDILGGNISYSDAQLLINTGSSSASQITQQDTLYNSAAHSVKMPSWPAPFHLDIDNDGDKDILFTAHNENANTANYEAVAFYKNIGTDLSPNFVYQHDSLLTPDMIDVGSYSYPAFFDFDKDGKKDLFIGTEGYLDNLTGIRHSKIAYYRNTSSVGVTSFELISKDFLGLSVSNYNGIFPTFGDLTGDGLSDLVFGNVNGYVTIYKNYASSDLVTPNFMFFTDSLAGITVDHYSAPCIFDFNQDGKTDLLLGNRTGKIAYYEDTSSTNQKKLALQTISLGDVKAGDVSNIYGYCAPFIGKMDNTNKDFLLVGNIDGTIGRYDNFINNLGTFQRIDSNYSEIQTLSRSVPAIADLDGDGNYEMVIGNKLGGLSYFKQVKNVLSGEVEITLSNQVVELYPNPANEWLQILFKTNLGEQDMVVDIYDLSDKLLFHRKMNTRQNKGIDISNLSSGMYMATITIGDKKVVRKFIKR